MTRKILITLAVISVMGCASVGTGYRGVKTHFSHPTGEVVGEGFYMFNPLAGTGIVPMNVQIVADKVEGTANSQDLQGVNSTVTVNYHLDPNKVNDVYEHFRQDWQEVLIDPSAHESIKAAIGHYQASALIQNRDAVRDAMQKDLTHRLSKYGIAVDQVLITDFSFNPDYQASVERKAAAQQNLQAARIDAQTAEATAKGAAAAQRAQKVSLSPMILEKMTIDKWDGHFPQYMMGAGNINLMRMLGDSQRP